MDIIDYLLHNDHKEVVNTLIMLFGVEEFLTALQYNNITVQESIGLEYSIAYLTIN